MMAPQPANSFLRPHPIPNRRQRQQPSWKLSRLYCWMSVVGAALAILTAPTLSNPFKRQPVRVESTLQKPVRKDFFWDAWFGKVKKPIEPERPPPPVWLRWIMKQQQNEVVEVPKKVPFWMKTLAWIDPKILNPDASTLTSLIDKILTSTIRLLLIANWLIALTVLMHSAIADWFLGDHRHRIRNGTTNPATAVPLTPGINPWTNNANTANNNATTTNNNNNNREKMGGFLVFKLLLISAVVAPDTLDLLILLSWYTILSFLRSLSSLCAQQTESVRLHGTNMVPSPGVWQLLVVVLTADLSAAVVCVALFHGAGTDMVLLLTCDCALLAVDIVSHILQHLHLVWDIKHSDAVEEIEEQQLALHERQGANTRTIPSMEEAKEQEDAEYVNGESFLSHAANEENLSRELDRRMEDLERQFMRRTSFLESSVFVLQLSTDLLTIAHFLHIWTLHGIQFTLIDGVLALHLHSAISAASKKVIDRRNLNKIVRDMDGTFDDATELELRKASSAGDVCCICLGTMSYCQATAAAAVAGSNKHGSTISRNTVKKVACGHMYHSICLREVIERARSMEVARCPMCRASIVHGRMDSETERPAPTMIPVPGERALFRFSTEHMLPTWLPLPAFSFEVVRRPAMAAVQQAPGVANNRNDGTNVATNNSITGARLPVANAHAEPQQSFLRRILLLSGIVQMTEEEERAALEQLVDMFPQYDRQDLLEGLRQRGSPETVADSIFHGSFVGVPRGVHAR